MDLFLMGRAWRSSAAGGGGAARPGDRLEDVQPIVKPGEAMAAEYT
jgi:hypothetical protein